MFLFSLLSTKRLLIADEYTVVSWEPYKNEDLSINEKPSRYEHLRILPRHRTLRLNNPELDYLLEMERHHEELLQRRFAYVSFLNFICKFYNIMQYDFTLIFFCFLLIRMNDDPTLRSPKCHICNIDIEIGIDLHLISRQHKDGITAIKERINAFSRQRN